MDPKAKKTHAARKKLKRKIIKILKENSFTKLEIKSLKDMWKKTDSKKSLQPGRRVIQKDLCIIIDKVPGTINKWVAKSKGIFRHKKEGSRVWYYDLAEIFDWRVKYEQKLLDDEIADMEDQLEALRREGTSSRDMYWEEKAIKTRIERENAELDRQIKTGQAVMLGDVMKDWVEVGGIIKTVAIGIIKEDPKHQGPIMQLIDAASEEIQDRVKRLREINPEIGDTIFALPVQTETGECGFKKSDGSYCKYAAKKEGMCLIHWKKFKGK